MCVFLKYNVPLLRFVSDKDNGNTHKLIHIRCFRVFTSELRALQSTKIEQEMGNSSSHRGKRNVQHQNERPCRINIGVVGDSGTEELIEWFDVRFEIASNNAKLSLYPLSLSHYSFDLLFSLNKKKEHAYIDVKKNNHAPIFFRKVAIVIIRVRERVNIDKELCQE